MTKTQRARLTNTHTRTQTAEQVFRAIEREVGGVRVAAGPIAKASPGQKRVRISDEEHALHLQVRGPGDVQQLYIYGDNLRELKLTIARMLRNNNISIAFK